MLEFIPLIMFFAVGVTLIIGYPVAFTLAGVALLFAGFGIIMGIFNPNLLLAYPDRVFGTINNTTLIAVPLFILMGVLLERSKIAEELLENMGHVCSRLPAGLGISVVLVGAMLAASTGIVGATVVTMGLMSLPTMLRRGYSPELASGTICATGTLGQIIPPSIALVLLGDIISTAYQQAQLNMGVFNAVPVSVGDLFMGALIPGFVLVAFYLVYLIYVGIRHPQQAPAFKDDVSPSKSALFSSIFPPLALIGLVLGSIVSGAATPTEAAGIGALAALAMSIAKGKLNWRVLHDVTKSTTNVTAMVFAILLGASLFSLVFHGYGGETLIKHMFDALPGGKYGALVVVMLILFFLGFILDFIEITFVVVPLIAPALLQMGFDPIWLGIMIAVNLQTSFLTPPFGFALFYLRGVAPRSLKTTAIYRGTLPFIMIQLCLLLVLVLWPELVTWLPYSIKP